MDLCCRITVFAIAVLNFSTGFCQEFTDSVLPIVVITTQEEIKDEPKINGTMGIIYNGAGMQNSLEDRFNNFNGKIRIELRGSSSQTFPKKQYAVELQDDKGNDLSASLIDLPEEEDWVLFAPYNDKSLMRDVVAYQLAASMSRYAPRTRFVELMLNGRYQGVYVLIEKIKRDKNRVDISRLNPHDDSGDQLTGGYIIKIDKATGSNNGGWGSPFVTLESTSDQFIRYLFDYPDAKEITREQREYIQNFITEFETVMDGPDFADPQSGYHRYIDVLSFVDFMIMTELSKNVDGYRLSTFMHKDRDSRGGKLVMGPVWDFNIAFGNVNYCTKSGAEDFVYDFNSVCPKDAYQVPFWWSRLLQDEYFTELLHTRWSALRAGPLHTEKILDHIDSISSLLNEGPQQRNFQRWPSLGVFIYPNAFVGITYDEEVEYLKNWIASRAEWLDGQWLRDLSGPIAGEINVSCYPNPLSDEFTLRYDVPGASKVRIEIYSTNGRMVYNNEVEHAAPGFHSDRISMSSAPDGMYILKLQSGDHRITRKLVKGIRDQ
jgi:hypothetical protein